MNISGSSATDIRRSLHGIVLRGAQIETMVAAGRA
jgi:hypothetical protein